MSPIDPSPYGGEIMHEPHEPPFPQPKPGEESDEPVRGNPLADEAEDESGIEPDIGHRPALPDHPEQMAADIEDEEADPVIDTGPGIDDGVTSLKKQRG